MMRCAPGHRRIVSTLLFLVGLARQLMHGSAWEVPSYDMPDYALHTLVSDRPLEHVDDVNPMIDHDDMVVPSAEWELDDEGGVEEDVQDMGHASFIQTGAQEGMFGINHKVNGWDG